ncbi:cellulose synthase-like protein D5 [Cucumis melo var. makuwa]|uniref:Cellulose synthase-like protein D5 n=1 Tax=Cucumis melo var. makuwa TaxID=1194695 RepID=A0A5D3E0B6_CUCMM|nr:cellulose synthase-like protein D5 [Cucumis melo var. makuwa]TYK29527.1 cellulose synthase-like protein D5 [Cucumis melo var. makuwa]
MSKDQAVEDNENMGKLQISNTIFTGGFNTVTRMHVIKLDANNGGGLCPGCEQSYTDVSDDEANDQALSLLSMVDDSETKDSVGFGSEVKNDFQHQPKFGEKTQRPLTRKFSVSPTILIPYRLLSIIRILILGFYLTWRVRHPNHESMWLWRISNTCELWFALSWLLEQLPRLFLINRTTDISALKDRFESPNLQNPKGRSDLPGVDVFVTTADPKKEPPLVTANTILSILAVDYPVEKLACYLSDDAGSLLTFEALADTANFARIWVPFCRKHGIEPRNPEAYFKQKHDFLNNEVRLDLAGDWRRVKREYDEFKVRINSLPETIKRRSGSYNAKEELKANMNPSEMGENSSDEIKISKATWMFDGSYWPGTWEVSGEDDHSRGDHVGIIQVMLPSSDAKPVYGSNTNGKNLIDTIDVDIRLPMLVYMSREKRLGYNNKKKAGAMNALLRTSAIMSNGPFILNLDCDHYINNSLALREGMCFMLDKGGNRVCYVQFPQRFDGIDPDDLYANHNPVLLDVNMRAIDGIQGPYYIGTCCIFRRIALYGFSPARVTEHHGLFGTRKTKLLLRKVTVSKKEDDEMATRNNQFALDCDDDDDADTGSLLLPKRFGNSTSLAASIKVVEFQGRLLQELESKGNQGRPTDSLTATQVPLDVATIAKAITVISCDYEDNTEWGKGVGWISGHLTEDVLTGYQMHNRGWRSVYCITKHHAFRGTAPINLTDRLHQVLVWATGSVELFLSRNNSLFATRRMKFLQKVDYFNNSVYPFSSFFILVDCFLPAVSLFSGQFVVQSFVTLLTFNLVDSITLYLHAILENKWSGITITNRWRQKQSVVMWGTSSHPAAALRGLVKFIAGVNISYTLTPKPATPKDGDDEFADLYVVKWSFLMIPPITIMLVNTIAIAVGIARALYNPYPEWSKLIGGVSYSFWVLCHFHPFAKGLMGRRSRALNLFYVWSGLLSIIVLLLSIYIKSSSEAQNHMKFLFP